MIKILFPRNTLAEALRRRHMLRVGLMTPRYSRPLGSDDFGAQFFRGNAGDRLVQREADSMNWDILVCGGIFQESTLRF